MLIKGRSFQFRLTCVVQKWFVYVIAVVRRDHKQRIEMHQSEIDNLKGMFPERSSDERIRLGKSWMLLMRVIWKVGMKWATIEEEEGVNIF